jgi:hypothetical protein
MVSRRALLGGAAAAAAATAAAAGLAGCGSGRRAGMSGTSPSAAPVTPGRDATIATVATSTPGAGSDRDVALGALADEQRALAVYGALARRRPETRARIAALVAIQRRHVEALTAALELDRPPSQPTVEMSTGPPARAVGETATGAAAARLADCRRVVSGSLASMLGSMGAAHQAVASQWAPQ